MARYSRGFLRGRWSPLRRTFGSFSSVRKGTRAARRNALVILAAWKAAIPAIAPPGAARQIQNHRRGGTRQSPPPQAAHLERPGGARKRPSVRRAENPKPPRGGTRSRFLPPKAAPLRVPARRAGSHGDSLRGIQRGPVALFECASPLCGARRRRGAHLCPGRPPKPLVPFFGSFLGHARKELAVGRLPTSSAAPRAANNHPPCRANSATLCRILTSTSASRLVPSGVYSCEKTLPPAMISLTRPERS